VTSATASSVTSLVVIGAGPSGLAAAYEATRHGVSTTVLERLDRVGGLARTVTYNGHRSDIGPHRFFTMNREVQQLFVDILAEDIVRVPRLTRIYYRKKFFNYPLTPLNALFGVGIFNSFRIITSYLTACARRTLSPKPIRSFEDWVVDRFGRRLYETFFKTYTEKVWGISCQKIGSDWAGQRIKGLSLTAAVMNALFKPKGKVIKTLIDEFMYPRLGAGQLYEKLAARMEQQGGEIRLDANATRVLHDGFRVRAVEYRTARGELRQASGDFFLSSAPLTELLDQLDPPPPPEVLAAARGLRYRNHIGVNLVVKGAAPFPDNWIYIHSPDVKMARICDYQNFSKEMGREPDCHPLTIEYFVHPEEDLWAASDAALVELAAKELTFMGLVDPSKIIDRMVVRSAKAYPVIEIGFQEKINLIKDWLDRFENLLPIGRSGMFKYNNQDHAMATGLLAARTALGLGKFDPWLVNIDGIYHEGGSAHE
jgi:protoporphyrinogen oxidase